MKHSEALAEISAALAKAQAKIKGAAKDSENPFFRSKYADLASVWEACREALTSNGLSVLQAPSTTFTGEPEVYTTKAKSGEDRSGVRVATTVSVVTRLCHASGQWIEGEASAMLPAADPQAVGSAITYLRRYGLAAMVGVAPEDDDGEATTRAVPHAPPAARVAPTAIPFGKNKGKLYADCSDDELLAIKAWMNEKGKFADHVDAIDVVLDERGQDVHA